MLKTIILQFYFFNVIIYSEGNYQHTILNFKWYLSDLKLFASEKYDDIYFINLLIVIPTIIVVMLPTTVYKGQAIFTV
jgi:hypothetical protein